MMTAYWHDFAWDDFNDGFGSYLYELTKGVAEDEGGNPIKIIEYVTKSKIDATYYDRLRVVLRIVGNEINLQQDYDNVRDALVIVGW